jgi:hypothetical protein
MYSPEEKKIDRVQPGLSFHGHVETKEREREM